MIPLRLTLRCSVAAHTPTNDKDKIAVLVTQAAGKEIAPSSLTSMASLSQPLGEPLPQTATPAPVAFILLAVTPLAHPLAQAAPHLLSISQKVDNEIP